MTNDLYVSRIFIVDDHEVVREGLRLALGADPTTPFDVVGDAGSGAEAMRRIPALRPDVALLDYRLPDTTGDVLCRQIRDRHPSIAVIVLSTYLSEDIVGRCQAAGSAGFVTKSAGLEELRRSITEVVSGSSADRAGSASAVVARLHESADAVGQRLTPRQERVLELVVDGWTYGRIANELYVSESTVRFHIQRLKTRLGVSSKTELISKAIREALVAPGADATR